MDVTLGYGATACESGGRDGSSRHHPRRVLDIIEAVATHARLALEQLESAAHTEAPLPFRPRSSPSPHHGDAMPLTRHVERHFTSGDTVRDVVIGMSDGLRVPGLFEALCRPRSWAVSPRPPRSGSLAPSPESNAQLAGDDEGYPPESELQSVSCFLRRREWLPGATLGRPLV